MPVDLAAGLGRPVPELEARVEMLDAVFDCDGRYATVAVALDHL